MKTPKQIQKDDRIQWAIKKYNLATIMYFTRLKDWRLILTQPAHSRIGRWYNGIGWGFVGWAK